MIGIIKGQRDLDFKIGTLGFKDCKIRILGFNGWIGMLGWKYQNVEMGKEE